MKKVVYLAMVILVGSFMSCEKPATEENGEDASEKSFFSINENGELTQPTDYRSWVYVGTPLTPNDMNNGKAPFPEFHSVYIDPVSFAHWEETGEFRDGTILIKELISVGSKAAVSGNGYFMGDFIGLEATIKSKEHFPNEPGNWAYFSFSNPGNGELKNNVKAFPSSACNSCHETNAADDFVFTQYYPVLTAAKGVKDAENSNARPAAAGGADEEGGDAAAAEGSEETSSTGGEWDPTAETPESVDSEVPVNKEKLFAYLKNLEYQSFKNQESELHGSVGPHTKEGLPVKVFMNDKISESLANNNSEHPVGSAIVKEMYTADKELSGWAVMVKTQDKTEDGKGWFWYEVTSTTDANQIAAVGNGVPGCVDCHNIASRDMVRTSFPLN